MIYRIISDISKNDGDLGMERLENICFVLIGIVAVGAVIIEIN
jgi:hypothetical protein